MNTENAGIVSDVEDEGESSDSDREVLFYRNKFYMRSMGE